MGARTTEREEEEGAAGGAGECGRGAVKEGMGSGERDAGLEERLSSWGESAPAAASTLVGLRLKRDSNVPLVPLDTRAFEISAIHCE